MLLVRLRFSANISPNHEDAERARGREMREDSADYYRARERAERAAAQGATCPEARRAHEELAQAYARLVDMDQAHAVSASRSR